MYAPAFPSDQRDLVDLRSDTVTRPSEEMYEAMRNAPLGDDVLGDDPTVARLERLAAETLGKQAALFVPSGTMGNQIALASHCKPGDAILIEQDAHILFYEVGAPALIAGVVSWTLPSHRGAMDPQFVESRVLKANLHTPGTTLLCLENTHNRAGGAIIPMAALTAYRDLADRTEIKIHMDGARVFNATVALGIPVKEIADKVDSVNFCLSKGLRSPIGSLLCGDADFIERAKIWRKRLGGGLRQAGLLAACGIVSLTKNVERLAEDHARAKQIAIALQDIDGISTNPNHTETNMVIVETHTPAVHWQEKLAKHGVLCFPTAANRLRLVLHADIDDSKAERAINAFQTISKV